MNEVMKATLGIVMATGFAPALIPAVAQTLQNFPTKPIRLMVPSLPGSQPDHLARMMGEKMSVTWGRAVVIDNRPGAGGALAANTVAKSTPDGHTLLFSVGFAISAALQPNLLPYDPLKDFARVAQIGHGTAILVVAPMVGVKSVSELIALAKAQAGKIIHATSAAGSGIHLTGARFSRAAGINVITVAFKGGPEAILEVLAGRSHYTIVPLGTALPFIKDGKLLPLAVTAPQRYLLPDVPVLADTLPEFRRSEISYGMLAPAGTPRPILQQISKEAARILDLPDIRERLQAIGFAPAATTPEEYDGILREQIQILSKLVTDAGLRAK